MILKRKESALRLKNKISRRISQSHVPIIVYVVVITSMIIVWSLRIYNEEVAFNFLAELFGAAFTLFIIDVLLVRSKIKRWKIVKDDMDYLIARNINRLRDGISTRAFNFSPKIDSKISEKESLYSIRKQRAEFLKELEKLNEKEMIKNLNEKEIFSERSYSYFNERADDIWEILNMKYSEFFQPELVSLLIDLHTRLKDLCGHVRQYRKTKRFSKDRAYYRAIGISGVVKSLKHILSIVNHLKEQGYSEYGELSSLDHVF